MKSLSHMHQQRHHCPAWDAPQRGARSSSSGRAVPPLRPRLHPRASASSSAAALGEQQQQRHHHPQQQQAVVVPPPQQQPPLRDCGSAATTSGGGSRRQALARMLAAAVLLPAAAAAAPRPAAAAAAPKQQVSSSAALEEYMKLEDANKLRDQRSLDNIRSKYGIRRALDGRVQLRRKDGTWMSVRLDMEVPGAILLRDTKSGAVYALETDGLPQVDLSDDYVLFMMFADGQWEADMTGIEFEEEGGKGTSQLTMTEKEFHEFVGILGPEK